MQVDGYMFKDHAVCCMTSSKSKKQVNSDGSVVFNSCVLRRPPWSDGTLSMGHCDWPSWGKVNIERETSGLSLYPCLARLFIYIELALGALTAVASSPSKIIK